MIRLGAKFRDLQISAVCALTLSLVAVSAAAQQDSASAAANKTSSADKTSSASKTSTAKKTTSAPAHKPQSSSSASPSSGAKKTTARTSGKRSRRRSSKLRGQQKIDSERARLIQDALIRAHYLSGEPTGTWNQASEDAMRKYQADHGWQSKTVPDSRALISLGLGPSKDHLLNPESAMTTVPDAPKSDPAQPTSHSASPTGDPATPSNSLPTAPTTSPASGTVPPQ